MKTSHWFAIAFAIATLAAAPARAQEEERQGGSGDIKVHGHWTFDVRNADGSLASHSEFENSLVSNGASLLSRMLARVEPIRGWWIEVSSIDRFNIPRTFDVVVTPEVPVSGPNANCLVLEGILVNPQNADVTVQSVATLAVTQSGPSRFTSRFLGSGSMPLQAGQTLQVTVVISFS